MGEIDQLIEALVAFRDEREWEQFHDSKNLATAITIEAAELNELFLWKNGKEAEEIELERLREELADILAYTFLLVRKHNLDVKEILLEKIEKNAVRYPVDKAKGNATKYDEL